MDDLITVTGVVGSDPRHSITASGLEITSFRLASTRRVFDRGTQTWIDNGTNWYTVSTFRRLAQNVAFAVRKGEHIIVSGRFKLRAWETAEKHGTAAEIEADAVGHDLNWCVTRSARVEAPGGHGTQTEAERSDEASDRAGDEAGPGTEAWQRTEANLDADGDGDADADADTDTDTGSGADADMDASLRAFALAD
ncbi:MAG TPA: single-stranded DNA-binding protein [Candidatus Lumbricidophila sp.]|nr:single-stranded DNA-binding protein [Candidatus Lumbricidophila sp.]